MRYAKLVNNYPQYAPKLVHWHGVKVINPSPAKLADLGYKPVIFTEPDGNAPEGFCWSEVWTDLDTELVQGWELSARLPEEDIDPATALEIILRGETR